jgi:hypothetical protein
VLLTGALLNASREISKRRLPRKKKPAFAVVRFAAEDHPGLAEVTRTRLAEIRGIYDVEIGSECCTIQVLYDGAAETIHRLCMRLCETGTDVVAHMTPNGSAKANVGGWHSYMDQERT